MGKTIGYLHTDGMCVMNLTRAGYFVPAYVRNRPGVLVRSLKQIRQEQARAVAWARSVADQTEEEAREEMAYMRVVAEEGPC